MTSENKFDVDRWFYGLDESMKQDIIDEIYPGEIITDLDEMWRFLDYEIKLEIWEENQ